MYWAFNMHVDYVYLLLVDVCIHIFVGHTVLSLHDALERARELNLDLVEVNFHFSCCQLMLSFNIYNSTFSLSN